MKILLLNQGFRVISLIFLFFLSFCTVEKSELVYSEFPKKDSLEVLVPIEYFPLSYWSTFTNNGQGFLVEYGFVSNGDLLIHRVNFDKKIYLEPIRIPREGPDGFNSSSVSVYFHGIDSIFVFPAAKDAFYLYNSLAKKVKEFPYSSNGFARFYRSGFYSNAVLFDQILAIPTVSDIRYDDPDFFRNEIPVRLYDLNKEKFVSQLKYPAYLTGSFLPSEFSGPTLEKFDEDRMIVNYRFSDSLYLFNIKDKSTQAIYCGLLRRNAPPLLKKYPSKGEELDYKIKQSDFAEAFSRNGKIYRIVNNVDEKYNDLTGLEILQKNLRGVTLIELDLETKQQRFYEMPIAKYFVFDNDFLIVGGVSSREENGDIYRKFYKYSF